MKHKKRKVVELNCIPLYPDFKHTFDNYVNAPNWVKSNLPIYNKGQSVVVVSKGIARAFLVV